MMKRILQPILPMVLVFTAFNSGAQITIDQADFPVSQTQHRIAFFHELNEANFTTPSEGPDQIWDYQGLTEAGLGDFDWSPATDPFFTAGYHYEAGFVSLSAFTIRTDFYMGLDNFGYFRYGQQQYDTTFSLATVTGGANDELHFLADQQLYNNISDDVIFPMTYGDQWSNNYSRNTPFEITVAAFGLSNTPGVHKRTITIDREVVGYGKLLMSHPSTTTSDSMDVLLVKNGIESIDSFFVGGMPAPPALLAGMGVTQGSVTNTYHSAFYRQGYGDLLIEFVGTNPAPGSTPINMFFNENGAVPSTVGLNENTLSNVQIYPNPAAAGQEVMLDLNESAPDVSELTLFSLSGKKSMQLDFSSNGNQTITLKLPANLISGNYLIQGKDNNGAALFVENLFIIE